MTRRGEQLCTFIGTALVLAGIVGAALCVVLG
jgi:hypothetical protein